jgi:hypothetical protein
VPPLYLASFIGSFASPLPVNDQWSVAPFLLGLKEGHFSLERLFAFHNEHLIVIPRLCFAALSFVFTWDNRAECWFTFLLTAILFLLICRGAFPEKESRSFWVAVALLATSLMLFHTNQSQNWLWGFQLAWPLPVLSLVIAVVVSGMVDHPIEKLRWPCSTDLITCACILATNVKPPRDLAEPAES